MPVGVGQPTLRIDGLTESFVYLLSNGGKVIKHMVRTREDLLV